MTSSFGARSLAIRVCQIVDYSPSLIKRRPKLSSYRHEKREKKKRLSLTPTAACTSHELLSLSIPEEGPTALLLRTVVEFSRFIFIRHSSSYFTFSLQIQNFLS